SSSPSEWWPRFDPASPSTSNSSNHASIPRCTFGRSYDGKLDDTTGTCSGSTPRCARNRSRRLSRPVRPPACCIRSRNCVNSRANSSISVSSGIAPYPLVLDLSGGSSATPDKITTMTDSKSTDRPYAAFPVRIGLQIQPQHAQYADIRRTVAAAEEIGVDVVFNWDHFYPLSGEPE